MVKFRRDPSLLSESEKIELNSYVRIYAAEMQAAYGVEKGQEAVKNLFAYPGYERNPDKEVLNQAQRIVNTWGYHESNASIGDASLATLGSGVLGNAIKESMITNAAIGAAVNAGVQLSGPDPFSYVDAIMAGITAAATTGQSWKVSAAINMGGTATGSAIKGENPTNASLAAGVASVIGVLGGTAMKEAASLIAKDGTSEITGTVAGSYIGERTGNLAKDYLDKEDKK